MPEIYNRAFFFKPCFFLFSGSSPGHHVPVFPVVLGPSPTLSTKAGTLQGRRVYLPGRLGSHPSVLVHARLLLGVPGLKYVPSGLDGEYGVLYGKHRALVKVYTEIS